MVTFKGAMRTAGRMSRQIDRSNQRYAKEAAKRFKEQQKQQEIQNAQQAVADYQNYIDTIKGIHKNHKSLVNWEEIKNTPKPIEPIYSKQNELAAQKRLDGYKPGFFGKLLGNPEGKKARLRLGVENSKLKDQELHQKAIESYQLDLEEWEMLQKMCSGIATKDPIIYAEALEYFEPFADLSEIGGSLNFKLSSTQAQVDLIVNGTDVIPSYELNQTSTGKLSKKNLSATKFNELYQDHICSATLRIAVELFSFLPLEMIRVNALSKLLNPQNGLMEDTLILSVVIPRSTLKGLNLNSIDPSDSMGNFLSKMNFKKTTGFVKVDQVEIPNQ